MPLGFQLVDSWDYSGAIANLDFMDLVDYSEVMLVARGLSAGAGKSHRMLLSVDNSTFLAGTSYRWLADGNGSISDRADILLTNTTGNVQSHTVHFPNFNMDKIHMVRIFNGPNGAADFLVPNTTPLEGIRIKVSDSSNFSAGSIKVYGKR